MIITRYLLGSDMTNMSGDTVFLTIKLTRKLRVEFKAAARVDEMDVSNALRQFMNRTVRDVKEREPEQFKAQLEIIRKNDEDEKEISKNNPKLLKVKTVAANEVNKNLKSKSKAVSKK